MKTKLLQFRSLVFTFFKNLVSSKKRISILFFIFFIFLGVCFVLYLLAFIVIPKIYRDYKIKNTPAQNLSYSDVQIDSASTNIMNKEKDLELDKLVRIEFKQTPNIQNLRDYLIANVDENIKVEPDPENSKAVFITREGGWLADSNYNIQLKAEGLDFLNEDFTLEFETIGSPEVSLSNIGNQIQQGGEIYISFNQDLFNSKVDYSDIVSIEPKIDSVVQAITPSTLVVIPSKSLEKDKKFKLTISAGKIKNQKTGLKMKENYVKEFTVVGEVEKDDGYYNSLYPNIIAEPRKGTRDPIYILFKEEIQTADLKSKLELIRQGNNPVGFSMRWETRTYDQAKEEFSYFWGDRNKSFQVAVLTPNNSWLENNYYHLKIQSGLLKANGSKYSDDFENKFSVTGEFKFTGTNLQQGNILKTDGNYYDNGIRLNFSNPLVSTKEELKQLIRVYDTSNQETLYPAYYVPQGYYYDNSVVEIQAEFKDGKNYKVVIDPSLEDKYANRINQEHVIEFTAQGFVKPLLNIFGNAEAYVDSNDQDYKILIESRMLNNINVEVAKISIDDYISLRDSYANTYSNNKERYYQIGEIVRNWTKSFEKFETELDVKENLLQFQYNLSGLEDGIYVVRAKDPANVYADYRVLLVSSTVVMAKSNPNKMLVWLANTKTGKPVVNTDVYIKGSSNSSITSARTDQNGVAQVPLSSERLGNMIIYTSDGKVVANSEHDRGIERYNFISNYWDSISNQVYHVQLDRPIYNAGDELNYKIFMRNYKDNKLAIPQEDITVEVVDKQYQNIYSKTLKTNQFGTANDKISLDKNLNSGEYNILINGNPAEVFRIASFKPANYSFAVNLGEKEIFSSNQNIELEVDASYYFGDPLKNADVTATVNIRGTAYDFYTNILNNKYNYYEYYDYGYEYESNTPNIKIGSLNAKTDDNGNVKLSIPLDIPKDYAYGVAKSISIELKVVDDIGDEQYKTLYKTLAPKDGFIGINNDKSYVNVADKEMIEAEAVFFDETGMEMKNSNIKIQIDRVEDLQVKKRRVTGTYYWSSVTERIPVSTYNATTDKFGKVIGKFDPEKEGRYEIRFSLANNQNVTKTTSVYAYDSTSYWYYQYNDNGLDIKADLKTDKDDYKPGDVAKITPAFPNQNFKALITVERESIMSYEIVDLRNIQNLSLKISADMVPNVYYSVMAFSPLDFGGNKFLDFKMGLINITVDNEIKKKPATITTDKDSYQPGDTVYVNISNGQNKEYEFMIAVVDKAILDLSRQNTLEDLDTKMVDKFWTNWSNLTENYSNLTAYENKLIAGKKWGNKGGSGDGGPGNAWLEIEDLRNKFESIAYWDPAVISKNGNISLQFKVPDNLTTWTVVALGISKDTEISFNTHDLKVSNDVNIIPSIPEYLIKGDEAYLVYNASFDDALLGKNFTVKYGVENGKIECNGVLTTECETKLAAQDFPKEFKFVADSVGTAKTRFGIFDGGKTMDAEEREIEIKSDSTTYIKTIFGDTLSKESNAVLTYPAGVLNESKKIKVVITDEIVGELGNIHNYYGNYKNLCSEQTASKIKSYILKSKRTEEDNKQILEGISRLYEMQNTDGGWGVWPDNASIIYNSAHSYQVLNYLNNNGFEIDKTVLANAEKYLGDNVGQISQNDLKLLIWRIFSEQGKFDMNAINNYYDINFQNDSIPNKALLLTIYNNFLGQQSLPLDQVEFIDKKRKELFDYINKRKRTVDKTYYWQESDAYNDYYYNEDIKTSAIILESFSGYKPTDLNALMPIIKYLKNEMSNKDKYMSTSSYYSILSSLSKVKKNLKINFDKSFPAILVNGKKYSDFKRVDNKLVLEMELSDLAGNLDVSVTSENNSLVFFELYSIYDVKNTTIQPEDAGVAISTKYYDFLDKEIKLSEEGNLEFNRGGMYKAKVRLFVKDDINQTEVRIPMPAGLNPIDFNLNLTSDEMAGDFAEENKDVQSNWDIFDNYSINQDSIVFYTGDQIYGTNMKKGFYEFVFYIRADQKGKFSSSGEFMKEMYFPSRSSYQDVVSIEVK
ncbi:hypothetical protein KBD45_03780 [Candidatus Dojkabacteria bacterium]|nr:hypothetical protein [Candidatus Dojkabacteria bacterium]